MVPFLCVAVSSAWNSSFSLQLKHCCLKVLLRLTSGVFLLCSNCNICKYIMKNLSCCFTVLQKKTLITENQYSYSVFILPNACSTTIVVCFCLAQWLFSLYLRDTLGLLFGNLLFFHHTVLVGLSIQMAHQLLAWNQCKIQARLIRSPIFPWNLNLDWSDTKAENSNIFMYPLVTNKWKIRLNIKKKAFFLNIKKNCVYFDIHNPLNKSG